MVPFTPPAGCLIQIAESAGTVAGRGSEPKNERATDTAALLALRGRAIPS
jgi:hypothetical protein